MSREDLDKVYATAATDGRYHREAFLFTLEALNVTATGRRQKGLIGHITGQELCEGIRAHAESSFGFLTKTVFALWGVGRTEDFGEIVFALVRAGIVSMQETDSPKDFQNRFDFDEVFERQFIYE